MDRAQLVGVQTHLLLAVGRSTSWDVGLCSLASIFDLVAWKQGLESSADASAGRGPAFHNGLC